MMHYFIQVRDTFTNFFNQYLLFFKHAAVINILHIALKGEHIKV